MSERERLIDKLADSMDRDNATAFVNAVISEASERQAAPSGSASYTAGERKVTTRRVGDVIVYESEEPMGKPFSELRAQMSPEAQERATARTQEMLKEMEVVASRPEPSREAEEWKRLAEQSSAKHRSIAEKAMLLRDALVEFTDEDSFSPAIVSAATKALADYDNGAAPPDAATKIFDNHHNALSCPYCNPKGYVLADPKQVVALDAASALVEKWRERERKLCRRADEAEKAGNSGYAKASAGQAERIAECADELEAALRSAREGK